MGFIQAFTGALGGTLADQWKDYFTIPADITPTSAMFPAVQVHQNAGRGTNTKGSQNIITNGSKIIVPEGYGLLTFEDGKATGLVAEAGGYEWRSDDQNAQSIFAGDGIISPLFKTTWERFKFGGQPGSQQTAVFVSLKEMPNNRFGTQSEIYWDDAYLNAQVGAVTRGSYTIRISDPLLFIKNVVPASYLTGMRYFDFTDESNPVCDQLFTEVVASLAQAFSIYTNDPDKGNRISKIQQDSVGFGSSLAKAVQDNYQWETDRGLTIVKVALASIEYDADTRALLSDVKKADALSGGRSASFMNQSLARGVQSAGESGGGGAGLAMFGMGAGAVGPLFQQQTGEAPTQSPQAAEPAVDDSMEKLTKAKQMLDAGLITDEDYQTLKTRLLGL